MPSLTRVARIGAIAVALLTPQAASAVTIDSFNFVGPLQVDPGSLIDPATISFPTDFSIVGENGALTGDLVGLSGTITGDYTFTDPAGASSVVLTSPTAPNSFTIDDGTDVFSADIDLIELQAGGSGTILGSIDFLSSTYAGTNPGLMSLNSQVLNGINVSVSFATFGGSGVSLDDLFDNGTITPSFYIAAVNLTAVPEPGPLAMLGLGLLCSAAFAWRRPSVRRRA